MLSAYAVVLMQCTVVQTVLTRDANGSERMKTPNPTEPELSHQFIAFHCGINPIFTFRMRYRQGKMYIGYLSVNWILFILQPCGWIRALPLPLDWYSVITVLKAGG